MTTLGYIKFTRVYRLALIALISLISVYLSGCTGVAYTRVGKSKVPELPAPSRPVLEDLTEEETKYYNASKDKDLPEVKIINKLGKNVEKLVGYTKQLDVTIREYNLWAKENNRLVNEELGIVPDAKKGDK